VRISVELGGAAYHAPAAAQAIKTIDLTKDGLAVPCDDIASVSLDLWARERGYTRIKNNIFGI
jgi:formate dehydrogenase maturation protein FdhE